MLTITQQASEAIRGILASDGIPDGSVLRISPEQGAGPQGEAGLAVSLTESPPAEDQLVEGEGVEVSVEQSAAELLDDKELDATIDEGQVSFTIGEQGDEQGA